MSGIEHVFVLMLENRSFDHMLGYSGITGTDAESGAATAIRGLQGGESNSIGGQTYKVAPNADYVMPLDPKHEFLDVLAQLCGTGVRYAPGGAYPPINNSGYAASYAASGGTVNPGEVLKCYSPAQLPVLNALAGEFAVCDNWHASMPGPTWPNRMFVHAASSGGLDHSPTSLEIAKWEAVAGFSFPNGSIFDRLSGKGVRRRLYGGDDFPMVAALKGIHLTDVRHYSQFAADVSQANYSDQYIFIEPNYDVLHDYKGGTSQHPLADVTHGEALIKATYEAIRNSPAWPTSMLILVWDEHGGFFDHAIPPAAPAPGDGSASSSNNQNGFTFTQYGPRVPAVVISPLIPKNVIDHSLYDHGSIPATLEALFGVAPLTQRDGQARHVDSLCTLSTARGDAPATLPAPANSGGPAPSFTAPAPDLTVTTVSRPADSINEGNLPAIVHSAMRQDLAVSPAAERQAIVSRVGAMKTRGEAFQYMKEVQAKVRPVKEALSHP